MVGEPLSERTVVTWNEGTPDTEADAIADEVFGELASRIGPTPKGLYDGYEFPRVRLDDFNTIPSREPVTELPKAFFVIATDRDLGWEVERRGPFASRSEAEDAKRSLRSLFGNAKLSVIP